MITEFTGLDFLKTLSDEELAKVPTLTNEEIEEAFRQGKEEARQARENYAPPRSRGIRFR
jgi:hypothetical protein